MYIGQKVVCEPQSFRDVDEETNRLTNMEMTGHICYIHPKERFVTVEFRVAGCTIRESFKPWDVRPCK